MGAALDPIPDLPEEWPEPVTFGEFALHGVGALDALTRTGLGVLSSRLEGPYQDTVARVAVEAAAAVGDTAIWVRLAPNGAESTAVSVAEALGVPVVAVVASGPLAPPPSLLWPVLASGGCVVSKFAGAVERCAEGLVFRDQLIATAPAAIVAVDGNRRSPDALAAVGLALKAATPLVVARPKGKFRETPDGMLAMALAGETSIDSFGWDADTVRAVGQRDVPAAAVCDSRDDLAAAVRVLVGFGGGVS